MEIARLALDPAFRVGTIDPRLRGSFVEHLGRCVYGGIYEPGQETADEQGFRGDVLEATRELGISTVRYPGGNFVSGYRWEDGIGPRADRPRRLDLAWNSLETNEIGLDEFVSWCRKAEAAPMLAVNLGTRGVEAAAALVEYANHPGGTYWSDLRKAYGSERPHEVKIWCLGNEMDGPWQIGHKTSRDYGLLAAQAGHAMKLVDPSIELVACGSSGRGIPTFGSWEAEVLEHSYDTVDFVSLHSYYRPQNGDLASFLASAVDMDAMIEEVVATCDYVKAKLRKRKTIRLSYDEWNVWHSIGDDLAAPEVRPWDIAPRLAEDSYSRLDAVVVGSLLNSLYRHADRVAMACFAQLVNVIAPMMTEPGGGPLWRQSTFHPMRLAFTYARGDALRVETTGPRVETSTFGDVAQLDATASLDDETGALTIMATNRSLDKALGLEVDLRAFGSPRLLEHVGIGGSPAGPAGLAETNSAASPDRVTPQAFAGSRIDDTTLRAELPPASWSVLRLTVQNS